MSGRTIPSDFLVQIGKAGGGQTFVRVVHIATGKERGLVGIGEANPQDIAYQMAEELAAEVRSGARQEPVRRH